MKIFPCILILGLCFGLAACGNSPETFPTQVSANPLPTLAVKTSVPTRATTQKCQIAYITGDDNGSEIYVMDEDGNNVRQLTSSGGYKMYPTWLPDGTRIAYTYFSDSNGSDVGIDIMDLNGGNIRHLIIEGGDPTWSPDGAHIAFTSYTIQQEIKIWGIYVMDADGGNKRFLASIERGGDSTWSPDGKHIAYVSQRPPNYTSIFVVDTDGSNVRQLTPDDIFCISPSWSPDGTQIVFQLDDDAQSQIGIMNADGSNLHSLTPNEAGLRYPSWSPDGTHIIFSIATDMAIKVMDPDGGNMRLINSNGLYPAWSPNCK